MIYCKFGYFILNKKDDLCDKILLAQKCTITLSLSLSLVALAGICNALNAGEYNNQNVNNDLNITDTTNTTNSTFNGTTTISNGGTLNANVKNTFNGKITNNGTFRASGEIILGGKNDQSLINKGTLNVTSGSTFKKMTTEGSMGWIENIGSGILNIKGGADNSSEVTFESRVINQATSNAVGNVWFKGDLTNGGNFNAGDGATKTIIDGNIINGANATLNVNNAILT